MTDAQIEARLCAEFWLWFAFTTLIPINTTSRFESMALVCKGIMQRRGK
jgi:hypothetical protein